MVQDLWNSTARATAVETKVEEAAKRGKPEVRNFDKTRGETLFLSDNETKRTMKFTWWKRPVPWFIMQTSRSGCWRGVSGSVR